MTDTCWFGGMTPTRSVAVLSPWPRQVPDPRRTASVIPPLLLEVQAVVSAEDVERAKLAAERDGSKLLNALLNAETEQQ